MDYDNVTKEVNNAEKLHNRDSSRSSKRGSHAVCAENNSSSQHIGFIEFVKILSKKPWDIHQKMKEGQTYAHIAAADEDIGSLINILENECSLIDATDDQGHTPLSLALIRDKLFSAKTLISNGCKVNIGGGHTYGTCLNIVVCRFQIHILSDILKKGGNPNLTDQDGNSPLHYILSAFSKDPKYAAKIATLILQYGGDTNLRNDDGWCPIHLAVKRDQLDAIKFILAFNADLQKSKPAYIKPFNINKRGGEDGQTPLHLAALHQDHEILSLLL